MYVKTFTTEQDAQNWCGMKNGMSTITGQLFAVTPSPYDDEPFAGVDLKTAIELGLGYEIVYR